MSAAGTAFVIVEDLPPVAQELIALIGWDATLALIKHMGGVNLRVPLGFNNNPAGAQRAALLEDILGHEAAARLIAACGGTVLQIPTLRHALARARNAAIRADYDAGATLEELAIKYRLTSRAISAILKGSDTEGARLAVRGHAGGRKPRPVADGQMALFP
ncbi:MAG: hypothetical protein LBF61_02620 [Azoarcus sp.]|jgi:hypothetical protein|nr:hypothetical protein [Azoarcus sp.]